MGLHTGAINPRPIRIPYAVSEREVQQQGEENVPKQLVQECILVLRRIEL